MRELGTLTIKLHLFYGPERAHMREIVLHRRHSCTEAAARETVEDFKKQNKDIVNPTHCRAQWQAEAVELLLSY